VLTTGDDLGQVAPRAAFLKSRGLQLSTTPLSDLAKLTDSDWAVQVAGVSPQAFFSYKEDYMEAQADLEYESGQWEYFLKDSMP